MCLKNHKVIVGLSCFVLLFIIIILTLYTSAYLSCNNLEAIQRFAKDVQLLDSGRKEYMYWELEFTGNSNVEENGDIASQRQMWREKVKSISKYSSWRCNPYHIIMSNDLIIIPLYGPCGHYSRLYIYLDEQDAIKTEQFDKSLQKVDKGIFWKYTFWPYMRG